MDPATVKPGRCAELPVHNPLGDRLVEMLDQGESLAAIFPVVKAMAGQFAEQDRIRCSKTKDAFEDGSRSERELLALFHTINRKTLRSLVLGFLAVDLHREGAKNWENVYAPNGSGTYVIAVSIKDRDGMFLNRWENKELAVRVDRYARACAVWAKIKDSYGQQSQVEPQEADLLRQAMEIDNELLVKKNQEWSQGDRFKEPKCWSGRGGTANAEALVQMLARRRDRAFDAGVFQAQSPVYVGCAHQVKKRMLAHDPDLGSLAGSSSMLKLSLACIRSMSLRPLVTSIPLVMVWEEDQIPLAEILVTVLAQSLISLHGFNIVQPGTNAGIDERITDHYRSAMEHVWLERPWFRENLEKSIADLSGGKVYEEAVESIGTDRLSADGLRGAAREIAALEDEVRSVNADLQEGLEATEQRNEELERYNALMDEVLKTGSGLFPAPPPSSGEG
ncbi:hypothetical protein DL769_009959 [Monosporascus sp. CRB-8-3]|nr:hypothetical protein DL769_009959 [Monosporascus sp. CRB-8-3]